MELKATNATPVKDSITIAVDDEDKDLDKPYLDKRSITISLIHNYSDYRKANMKVMGQKKEVIGSSISSCRILSSNVGEVEAYFPSIIGLSPNNPNFVTRVKAWLSNIQFVISNNDAKLDISFMYNTKRDYINFKRREDKIEEEYNKVDRSNISSIKEAIKLKIDALNTLEGEKYLVGKPVNVEEYLMYRHCLLYKDVAKDTALINSDSSLRFYIKDENREQEKRKKLIKERTTAMSNFIELNGSEQKFNAIYTIIVTLRNENISEALLKDRHEKVAIVMDFVNNDPIKFNKLIKDPNIITKAFIETLIVRGELIRAEFNQQISTADGNFIGSNMNEAIAYFNNPNNKEIRNIYENKLKLF